MNVLRRATTLDRVRGRALEIGEQALEAAEQVQDELADKVTEMRRNLADQIDPDRAPRRLRRWLLIGGLLLALGMVAGALGAWRSRRAEQEMLSNGQHPNPEHVPAEGTGAAAGNGVNTEAR
jgi:hypothetical protein